MQVAISEKVNAEVSRQGFSHVAEPFSSLEFESLCASLGTIRNDFLVRIDKERRNYVCKPDAIAFHNDDRSNRYLAWHCIEPDPIDGSSLILEGSTIFDQFTPEELNQLSLLEIEIPHYARVAGAKNLDKLVFEQPYGYGLCYSPWLTVPVDSEKEISTLAKFKSALARATDEKLYWSFKLAKGEVLVIDNWRVLHGRGAISPSSPRQLRRLWIS